MCEEFTSNLLAYNHHFEQEALLGSIAVQYCITPPFLNYSVLKYSVLPKAYGKYTVSEIGGIRLLVLKFSKDV